jgi:hypothetical protein
LQSADTVFQLHLDFLNIHFRVTLYLDVFGLSAILYVSTAKNNKQKPFQEVTELSESSRAIDSPDTLDSLLNFLKQADSPVSGIMELRGILVPTLFNFFTSSLTAKQ